MPRQAGLKICFLLYRTRNLAPIPIKPAPNQKTGLDARKRIVTPSVVIAADFHSNLAPVAKLPINCASMAPESAAPSAVKLAPKSDTNRERQNKLDKAKICQCRASALMALKRYPGVSLNLMMLDNNTNKERVCHEVENLGAISLVVNSEPA